MLQSQEAKLRQLVIANTLRSCRLCAGLPAADISAVAAFTISKNLAKGEYLFHEGARSEGFYIVQTGSINLHHVSADPWHQPIRSAQRSGKQRQHKSPPGHVDEEARPVAGGKTGTR